MTSKTVRKISDTCREWDKVMHCKGDCDYNCPLRCFMEAVVNNEPASVAVKRYFEKAINKTEGRKILAERAFQGLVRAYYEDMLGGMEEEIKDFYSLCEVLKEKIHE